MKKIILSLMTICFMVFTMNAQVDQDPQKLEDEKAKKAAEIAKLQEEIDRIDKVLSTIDLTGWNFGGTGGINFAANGNRNWASADVSAPNSGLNTNAALDVYANFKEEKYFWYNGLNVQQNYLSQFESGLDDFNLSDFTSRILDKLYFQSVPGYRINSDWAASGAFDLESSLGRFLNPGYVSGGLGVTWTPTQFMDGQLIPLRVMFHPLTWQGTIVNVTEPDPDDPEAYNEALRQELGLFGDETLVSQFGLKFVADYGRTIRIIGNNIAWKSQLRGFAPYTSFQPLQVDGDGNTILGTDGLPMLDAATGPMTLNWDNAFSILIFKNIALAANWNLRMYDPEHDGWQHLYNAGFGLSTTF